MSISYDNNDLSVTFSIGDFPAEVQDNLLSTLDINGFVSNEIKFREIISNNISKVLTVPPKVLKKIQTVVKGGNILTLQRDAEKPQFGLNFALNRYMISLGVVPGKTVAREGVKTLAIIGISKHDDFYITAYEDEDGNFLYAGKVKPCIPREKLFSEPLDEVDGVIWVDPRKTKKIKVKHKALHFSIQPVYSIEEKKLSRVGEKLSSIAQDMEIIDLVDEPALVSQLTSSEDRTVTRTAVTRLARDEEWISLRRLSWDNGDLTDNLAQVTTYLRDGSDTRRLTRVQNLFRSLTTKQAGRLVFQPGDHVSFNVPTVTAPKSSDPTSQAQFDHLKEYYTELKSAGSGVVDGVAISNQFGNSYWIVLDSPIPDKKKKFIVREEHLVPHKGLTKIPVTAPLSEREREEMKQRIGELEKVNPDEARRLMEKYFALTKMASEEENSILYVVCSWCRNKIKYGLSGPYQPLPEEEIAKIEKANKGKVSHGMCLDCLHRLEREGLLKEASSKTPPVVTTEIDGRTYTVRVRKSERTTAMGNWHMTIDEDGKTIAAVDVAKWPEKNEYQLTSAYVMTQTGQWEDADDEDLKDLEKLKPFLIDLARKYELWSTEIGPKSDIANPDDWDEYKKFHGIEKESAYLIYSSEYQWMYSPIKGGTYGRLSWLVPATLEQTRIKDDKWDPSPLTEGDLEILRNLVKAGKRSPKELRRELNYHREWYSGKWTDKDKENIRNEVLERVTSTYQAANKGQLPPFLKDPFKVGDRVLVTQGDHTGGEGVVTKVNPDYNSIIVEFSFRGVKQTAAIPFTHAKVLPKQETTHAPQPKPAEPKRQYVPVKEELEKILSNFQPGNWHAFMHGVSPKRTKIERLMHMYRERAQFGRAFPTLQEIMETLDVDNTTVSHMARALYERAQKVDTPEKARAFLSISKTDMEKRAGFMPSIGNQPFWDQRNDGGGTGDYKYPLEVLYPDEWADTWNAYANIPEKEDPNTLMNILRKLRPLSKEEIEDAPIEKKAILDMDPDIAVRFYIPKLTITIPDGPAAGEYEAQLIGTRPASDDKLTGITPSEKSLPPIGKTPAEKIQEGKVPVLPVPQEGDHAPIYFLPLPGKRTPSDKPFKPLTNTSEVTYQVRYVKGPNGTAGTVVGYFDASEFLTYAVRKGQEQKGLSDWLSKKLTDKASEIGRLLERTSSDIDPKVRLSWQTRILQDIISEDWESAFLVINNAGLSDEEAADARKPVIAGLFSTLYRERKFKELAEAIKKFRLMPSSWKGINAEEAKERLETLDLLAGRNIAKPSSPEFGKQVNLILDGNDIFPDGGSIEAKRKVIRDMDIGRLLEYVISDRFTNQPYAVQSAAARRLETAGSSGEEGLFALWKNKKLPASIRKEVLRALVLAYGVGKESQGYSAAGRFKATNNLLTEAAEDSDADIRALAYTLMKDSSVDFLPWTNKGKLVYSPEKAESKRNQPSRDIPEWMLVQLRTEPYTELRNILYDLIEELPHDLVQEETPPTLSPELKVLRPGKYVFKTEVLSGIQQLILTALRDTDPRVRSRVRNWFNLPREIELLKKKEEAEPQVMAPSAKDYLFQAKVALTQNNLDDVEKQIDAASKARDAEDYKEEIASLRKRVKELRGASEEKKELEKKKEDLYKAVLSKYPVGGKVEEFLNWAANLKFSTTYESLSARNKIEVLSLLLKDDKWFKHWSEKPQESADKVIQPELPLDNDNNDKWDEPFEKKGSPLSKMELTARQPPTTWELGNSGPGYSVAVPLGERDDSLLLKDVRQFYGRPEGKWRSLLNLIYNVLFKKKEEAVEKKAEKIEIKDREAAVNALRQSDSHAAAGIEFLSKHGDEGGLLEAVKELKDSKSLLKRVLQGAVGNGFIGVAKAVFDLPYPDRPDADDIHIDAIRSLYEMKAIGELGKILFTPWHPLAIKYLVALGQSSALKSTFREHSDRPSMQRHIVLNIGENGDIPFLEEALSSPNEEVRLQAVEWLKHHKKMDVLKKHLGEESNPKVKGLVERYLALEDEGPIASALDQLSPEEQERKINELVKIATSAFTKWDKYPDLRRQVLGREGRRYGISSFNEWKAVQEEVDAEIKDKIDHLPTIEQGSAAVRDLEKIVTLIPESSKRTKRLQEWITEAEDKYRQFSVRPDNTSDEQWADRQKDLEDLGKRIKEAKENLQKFELGPKATLEFRVEQLKLLERSAKFREELMDGIRKSEDFKKEYGSGNQTWKIYQAYLKTFDKDVSLSADAKPTLEGLQALDKDRKDLEKKYTAPIRAKYKEQEAAIDSLLKKLTPFYQKMKVNLSPTGEAQPARVTQIDQQLRRYRQLEEQWYKLSGAIAPYAEVDDVKYRISPAVWLAPNSSTAFPEYARGKRLLPEQVNLLKSPWSDLIRELEKTRQKLQDNFNAKLKETLPPQAQELVKEKEEHEKKLKWYGSILSTVGVSSGNRDKELLVSKKEYDSQRKDLLEKLKTMDDIRDKSPEEYIKLRRRLTEFMEKYGVPPIPDTPEANLKKQYYQDRWKSPYVRGPLVTPYTVTPGPEAPPYSNIGEWSDEERKQIEEEIQRRVKEYGPAKDEFGKEI